MFKVLPVSSEPGLSTFATIKYDKEPIDLCKRNSFPKSSDCFGLIDIIMKKSIWIFFRDKRTKYENGC